MTWSDAKGDPDKDFSTGGLWKKTLAIITCLYQVHLGISGGSNQIYLVLGFSVIYV